MYGILIVQRLTCPNIASTDWFKEDVHTCTALFHMNCRVMNIVWRYVDRNANTTISNEGDVSMFHNIVHDSNVNILFYLPHSWFIT